MKVAVFGAGAVGGYYGGCLALAGHDVSFIARGAHLRAMRERGLTVRVVGGDNPGEQVTRSRATDDPAEVGPVDYVLFAVKAFDTERAGAQARPLIGPHTAIVTIQNGLDAPFQLARLYDEDRIIAGATVISVTVPEPGIVEKFDFPVRMTLAELRGERTPRVEAFAAAIQALGIQTTISSDPRHVLWNKFLFLASFAAASAAGRATQGELLNHEPTRALMGHLLDEITTLAGAEGLDLREAAEGLKRMQVPPETAVKSSLQRDFEKGRQVEVEELLGAVVNRGRRHGIPTPYFETLHALLSLAAKVGYRYAG